MSNHLIKLSNLWSLDDRLPLVEKLSNIGVIAGGSIVYTLNDFVPSDSVGDIDVYINDKQKFIDLINYIKFKYPVEIEVINFSDYEQSSSFSEIGIVNITLPHERVKLQLILIEYDFPMQIIESFDLDYVQCAFFKDSIYTTNQCNQAFHDRKIYIATEYPPSFKRLKKAISKGFSTILIGEESSHCESNLLTEPLQIDELRYITRRKSVSVKNYEICNLKVNKFILNKKTSENHIITGSFVLNDFSVRSITIKLNFIELDCQQCVKINPVKLDFYTIERCNVPQNIFDQLVPGEYYARIRFYLTSSNPKFYVCEVFPITTNIIPLSLDNISLEWDKNIPSNDRGICSHYVFADPLDLVKQMMKKYTHETTKIGWAKHQAYDVFFYKYEETNNIKTSVRYATGQMRYDRLKYAGYTPDSTVLSSTKCNTIDDLLTYIEHKSDHDFN